MKKLQEISDYIGSMKIKKTIFGGYNREDVFVKMKEIVNMFQECMDEGQVEQKKLIEEYEHRLQASQLLVAELNKKVTILSQEQKRSAMEREQMKSAYEAYCEKQRQQYSESLESLSAEVLHIMENITNLQQRLREEDIREVIEVKVEEGI